MEGPRGRGSGVAVLTDPTARPVIAHRGDKAHFPENTFPSFDRALELGADAIEFDIKFTSDGVPVAMHDDTVDRTTSGKHCEGLVSSPQLAACPSDVLGSPGGELGSAPSPTPVPIPTLRSVLEFARDAGARVSLEIKNLPTDNDFDLTLDYAKRVLDVVAASGFPRNRLVIQSFWPPNLLAAQLFLPGAATALLTQPATNLAGAIGAGLLGYTWWSPAWPITASDVRLAHLLGRRVVPYTLDTASDIGAAAAAGVDAVITDDPAMARATLGG